MSFVSERQRRKVMSLLKGQTGLNQYDSASRSFESITMKGRRKMRRRPKEHPRSGYTRHDGTVVQGTIVNEGVRGRSKFKSVYPKRRKIFARPVTYSRPERTQTETVAGRITRSMFEQSIATGLSVYTGNPLPSIIYNIYKTTKIGEKLKQKLSEYGVDKEIEQVAKDAAKYGINRVMESRIDDVSKRVTSSFQAMGFTSLISNKTSLPENTVSTAFESTVKNIFEEGVEELSDFVVENI